MKRLCASASPRDAKGQAITEMLIFLPTLLLLFLGGIYLREMSDTKIRAIEAARYVTWQGVWYVRGAYKGGSGGTVKTTAQLRNELNQVGLGRNLIEARADMSTPSSDFTLGNYVEAFTTTNPPAGDPLGAFANPRVFPLPPVTSVAFAGAGALTPAAGTGAIGSLLSFASTTLNLPYLAQDWVAQNTNWTNESKKTIYAARVTYGFGGAGLFGAIPQIRIVERSNLLSHPYNIERTDNQGEYDEMFGCNFLEASSCSGRTQPPDSHVFDLWLVPTNPIPGVTVTAPFLGGIKRLASGNFPPFNPGLADLPSPFNGIFAWPKMPEGTLKEYPELNMTN
jgi:hypothetical protein